ncbi:MAG: S41 family peptidase [Anaerolineales bacterium]
MTRLLSVVLAFSLVFGAGYWMGQTDSQSASAQPDNRPELEETFEPFWETWDVLNRNYIDPLDPETLMFGAIQGMVEAVEDPNTNYMSQEEYERWQESLSGEFEGIGATVRQDERTGALEIISPLPDSPAMEAGVQAGDLIVEVGGEDITGLNQSEIVNRVRGPAGTPVRLGILREGENDMLEITVIRDRIILPDVEFEMLDGNVGYVRLHQFSEETVRNLRDALRELDANRLDGLVLDLRNNPGGFLETALQVISQFVAAGPILIEQLPGNEEQIFEARGGALAPTVPLAVIVDEGSASASELVAGSLRDRERAVIVGTSTFGKNTVQSIQPLNAGGALRVTIARWVTPDGNSSAPDGLDPDVLIEDDTETEEDEQIAAAIRALKGMQRNQLWAPPVLADRI